MKKLAIIFNTCGIKRENAIQYINGISSILEQDIEDSRVILSSCLNSEMVRNHIYNYFGDSISYNFIDEVLPVNVTFNHSCIKAREEFGEFEGYVYIDSGITMKKPDDLSNLYKLFKSGNYGMVASQTSTDTGYFQWFGVGDGPRDYSKNHLLFENGDFVIPVGKTVNLHVQIFSKEIFDAYNYIIPDIYAGHCTESVFSFICAAVPSKFVLSKDVMVDHIHGMDVGSAGFCPITFTRNGGKTYEHPFKVDSVVELAKNGQPFGFGYEECQQLVVHDPDKYDDNGYAKDERLKEYIKNNQYIGNIGVFDYNNVNYKWMA